jgi:hypothetical protein
MNPLFERYLKSIFAMTTDCLMGGITEKTYISNLETYVLCLKQVDKEDSE